MRQKTGWLFVVLCAFLSFQPRAWAAAGFKVEAGNREVPLTQQQIQTLSTELNNAGTVQKLETRGGRLEATLDSSTVSAAEIQGIVSTLRQTGAPFEVKIERANLSQADITALRNELAGLPVEFKVRGEEGVQRVKIEFEREENHAQRAEHPHRAEGPEREHAQRAEHAERVERPEREEVGHEEVEQPERVEVEHAEVERPETEEHHDGR